MIEIPIEDPEERPVDPAAADASTVEVETAAAGDNHLLALQRLQADFDNYRKRVARDSAAAGDAAQGEFARALLPFLDDFDRLMPMLSGGDAVASGIRMMHAQLGETLRQMGLEKFTPVGAAFDPHKHDAVATRPAAPDGHNKVMSVLQNGYIFKSRMLRPARVEVGQSADEEGMKSQDDA